MSTARVKLSHWAGIDWSDDHHCVHVVEDRGNKTAAFDVPHSEAGIVELCVRLRRVEGLGGVAIETSRHVVVRALLDLTEKPGTVAEVEVAGSRCLRFGHENRPYTHCQSYGNDL